MAGADAMGARHVMHFSDDLLAKAVLVSGVQVLWLRTWGAEWSRRAFPF